MNSSHSTLLHSTCLSLSHTDQTLSYQALCTLFETDRRADLVSALIERHHWTLNKAERAIDEYLMFLFVAAQPSNLPLVPTANVDCVWEADILQNTAQYIQTCDRFCGRIIHHSSATALKKAATFDSIERAFSDTQTLLSQRFGTEAAPLSDAAACGLL